MKNLQSYTISQYLKEIYWYLKGKSEHDAEITKEHLQAIMEANRKQLKAGDEMTVFVEFHPYDNDSEKKD